MKKVNDYANSLIASGMSPKQAVLQSIITLGETLPEYANSPNRLDIEKAKLDLEGKRKSNAQIGKSGGGDSSGTFLKTYIDKETGELVQSGYKSGKAYETRVP